MVGEAVRRLRRNCATGELPLRENLYYVYPGLVKRSHATGLVLGPTVDARPRTATSLLIRDVLEQAHQTLPKVL